MSNLDLHLSFKIVSSTPRTALLFSILFLIKYLDIPSYLFHPLSPDAAYDFYCPPYTIIPRSIFSFCCLAADVLTAMKLESSQYLYYSLLTPLDISSIENLLLAYAPSSFDFILIYLSPIFAPIANHPLLFNFSYYESIPCLNGVWYGHMSTISILHELFSDLIRILSLFLVYKEPRLTMILKPSASFKNHLLFVHRSEFLGFYTALYIAFTYMSYNFYRYAIVNTNFLYWISLLFVLCYVIDLKKQDLLRQRHIISNKFGYKARTAIK